MAITSAAVNATGATIGWLAVLDGDALRVVAAAGTDVPVDLVDARVAAGGASALVLASGQPMAVVPRGNGTQFSQGVAGRDRSRALVGAVRAVRRGSGAGRARTDRQGRWRIVQLRRHRDRDLARGDRRVGSVERRDSAQRCDPP